MKTFSLLIAAALLAIGLCQAPAHASSFSLTPGTSQLIATTGGTDTFTFSLSQPSTLVGSIFDIAQPPYINGNYSVSLFSGAPGSGSLVSSLVSTGTFSAFSYAGLATGTYYLQVLTTLALGAVGATYVIGASGIAATPIPPALLMFATALGGLGFVGYRRRKLAA